jgi:hypothetical protein
MHTTIRLWGRQPPVPDARPARRRHGCRTACPQASPGHDPRPNRPAGRRLRRRLAGAIRAGAGAGRRRRRWQLAGCWSEGVSGPASAESESALRRMGHSVPLSLFLSLSPSLTFSLSLSLSLPLCLSLPLSVSLSLSLSHPVSLCLSLSHSVSLCLSLSLTLSLSPHLSLSALWWIAPRIHSGPGARARSAAFCR